MIVELLLLFRIAVLVIVIECYIKKKSSARVATTARVVKLQLYCSALAQGVGMKTSTNAAYVDGDVVMENEQASFGEQAETLKAVRELSTSDGMNKSSVGEQLISMNNPQTDSPVKIHAMNILWDRLWAKIKMKMIRLRAK